MEIKGAIVGLGNPGEEYKNTRHNFGVLLGEYLIKKNKLSFLEERNYYKAWNWEFNGQTNWIVCLSKTYMNQSGFCAEEVCNRYGLNSSNLIVLHDELDLDFGKVRFKYNGGTAGHKGLESIVNKIGNLFYRLRLGIGRPQDKRSEIKEYVLSSFLFEELKHIPDILEICVKGLTFFCVQGMEKAMNIVHSFSIRKGEERSV